MFRVVVFLFLMCCAETFAYLHNAAFVCPRHCLYGSCNNIAREFYEFSKIYNHNKADVAEAKYKSLIENGSTLEAKVWGYLGLRLLGKITDKQAINNLQKLSGNVRFLKGKVLEVSPKQAYLWLTSDYLLVSPRFTVSNYPSIPNEYCKVNIKDFYIDISEDSQRKYAKNILQNASIILGDAVSSSGEYPCEIWAFVYLWRYANNKTKIADIDEIVQKSISNVGRVYCYELLIRLGEKRKAENLKKKFNLDKERYFTMSGCIFMDDEPFEEASKVIKGKRFIPLKTTSALYNRHNDKSCEKYNIPYSESKQISSVLIPSSERIFELPNYVDINQDGELSLAELFFIAHILSEMHTPNMAVALQDYAKYLKFYKGDDATFFTTYDGSWRVVKKDGKFCFEFVNFCEFGTHISFYTENILKSFSNDFYLSAMFFWDGWSGQKRSCERASARVIHRLASRFFDDAKKLEPIEWKVRFCEDEGAILIPIFKADLNNVHFWESVKIAKKKYELQPIIVREKFDDFCKQKSIKKVWED